MSRPFNPLQDGDPAIGMTCPLCDQPMKVGDVPSLVPRAPASPEDAEKMREGRPYTAVATVVHWDCVLALPTSA